MSVDAELIAAAQAGDQDAIARLYERYAPQILRYILVRVRDLPLAEDLVGDVFEDLLGTLPTYEDRGYPLKTFLYRVADCRIIDALRRRRRRPDVPLDEGAATVAGPDAIIDHLDAAAAIRVAWRAAQLTPAQRQVLALRYGAGWTPQETADAMGMTYGAVKALQHRAIEKLAAAAANPPPPPAPEPAPRRSPGRPPKPPVPSGPPLWIALRERRDA